MDYELEREQRYSLIDISNSFLMFIYFYFEKVDGKVLLRIHQWLNVGCQ